MPTIKVRTAIACEDLRQEMDGKLFAIGIQNPIIGRGKPRADGTWAPIKLHFILSLDVPQAGDFEMHFRLRPTNDKGGVSTTRVRVQFLQAADNIPFAIGPMRVRPDGDATGFALEQAVGENRWKRLADWRLNDMPETAE